MKNIKHTFLLLLTIVGVQCFAMDQKNLALFDFYFDVKEEIGAGEFGVTRNIFINVYEHSIQNSTLLPLGKVVAFMDIGAYEYLDYKDLLATCGGGGRLSTGFNRFIRMFAGRNGGVVIEGELFKVLDDSLKNRGLGSQMFLYALRELKLRYPNGIFYWQAWAFDGKWKELWRFYENFGAQYDSKTDYYYIDLAKLDLGIFTPKSKL